MTQKIAASSSSASRFLSGLPHTRLQARLTALLIVAAVPVFIIGALFINWRGREIMEQQAAEQLRLVNNSITKETSAQLRYSAQTLEQLSLMPAIASMDPDQQIPVLKAVNAANPNYYLVHVLDLNGINTARNDDAENKDYHDRMYFQIPVGGGPVTYQTVMGKTSGRPALTVGTAIRNTQGKIVGVVGIAGELTDLSSYVQASRIGMTGYAYVVDENNVVVAHPDPAYTTELTDFSDYPPVAMLRQAMTGPVIFTDEQGRAWHANINVLDNGWGVIVQQQDHEYLRTVTTFGNISLGVLAGGLLVLLVIIWLVIRQATRPIAMLTRTAAAIANGDLTQVATVTSKDEIGILAGTFNHMTSQLRSLIETLEQQVTDRTRDLEKAKVQAEQAQAAAEQANATKSRFLANMSHELRTPLNAILNFTEFVSEGIYGPVNEKQVHALQQSLTSGTHLLSLINDVLDITKIEAGMMELFIEEVDLNAVLASAVSVGKGLVKDKQVKLIAEIDEDLPKTFGDNRRLRQIFLNIVANAAKFTKEGSITIAARRQGDGIEVAIRDTGIGIAPEDYDKVFETFKQAKHDLAGTVGTGLGMPISKHFVEMHNGQIWFESQPKVGTTFHIHLPVLTEEQMQAISQPVLELVG